MQEKEQMPMKKCEKTCFFQSNALSLLSLKRSLNNCPHQSRLGYSSNNYEMPSPVSVSMAGLDPSGCLSRPEDYKDADTLKSCFYRSFIHRPLVWLLIERADACCAGSCFSVRKGVSVIS